MRQSFRILARGLGIAALFILLLVWNVFGWWPIPSIHGIIDAHIDLARGQYKLLGYGLPSPWRASYVAALRQRYGVEFHAVAGCIVSKAQQDYVAAYDDLSTEAVNRKFGHDVFREAGDEALMAWKQASELKKAR